ncbi:MAG: helix-turn-helix domain-containing protein [Blastocatellales bacterium]
MTHLGGSGFRRRSLSSRLLPSAARRGTIAAEGGRRRITQELWMDLKLLSRQGMSIRAIARSTGLSRNTVRRALAAKTPPGYKSRPAKPHKLEPYLDYLQSQLEQRPWISAA